MGNFFAYPEFAKKFGDYYGEEDEWQVSAAWQTGLNMASTVGGIFGACPQVLSPCLEVYLWLVSGHADNELLQGGSLTDILHPATAIAGL